jgi:2-iminobutanoate/2-iminopropanoate deaminase
MQKQIIYSPLAPKPIGPYHQAIRCEHLIYTSGQIPLDPVTNTVCLGGITEQTTLVLKHLQAVLESGGASLEKVLKVTVFLKDMNDFAAMNAVYGQFFQADTAPARTTVEVSRLPKDVLVEIEAVAHV